MASTVRGGGLESQAEKVSTYVTSFEALPVVVSSRTGVKPSGTRKPHWLTE